MKLDKLRNGDIIVVDYSKFMEDRPVVHYVVITMFGQKVATAFKGNVNNEEKPSGWLDLSTYKEEGDMPSCTVGIYRPKWVSNVFSADYHNEENYEILWEEK